MPPIDTIPANMRRALYLTERTPAAAPLADWVDPLMQLWRREAGLHGDSEFERRLAAEGLDRSAFIQVLAGLDHPVASATDNHDWMNLLAEMLDAAHAADAGDKQRLLTTLDRVPFGLVLWPFVLWSWQTLRTRFAEPELAELPVNVDALLGNLLQGVTAQLTPCIPRVMALELHIARLREELPDGDSTQRFTAFVARFRDPQQISLLLDKYPVLGRLLTTKTRFAVDAVLEAITRCATDLPALRDIMDSALPKVAAISTAASDAHRRGRHAMVLTFSDGMKLVYKPRSLAVDVKFQKLVSWANSIGVTLELPTMRVLDRHTHGWQEHIAAQSCTTQAQIARFYRRQGGFLALLYAVGAADMHRENLIAAGEYPYLVDLETLFHCHDGPRIPESANYRTYRLAKDSVLATGLLPFFVSDAEGGTATDLSGLGGSGGQATMAEILQWKDLGTDLVQAQRGHQIMDDAANRPTLDGAPVRTEDYGADILTGFQHAYDLLTAHRESVAGLLQEFAEVPVRYVIRGTYLYSLAREAGYHPDHLGNGLHRDRLLDRFWAGLSGLPDVEPIITAERADLLQEDVPYFHTMPGSHDLWDSRDRRISGYFPISGLEIAHARVARLGPADRELQSEFIKVALGIGARPHLRLIAPPSTSETAPPAEFLTAARQIGDRLLETAILGSTGQDVSWLEPRWMGKERWQLGPADLSLYAGLPGIALFLAYLDAECGDHRYGDAARAAVVSMTEMLDAPVGGPNASAFMGRGSAIYLYTHLDSVYGTSAYREMAIAQADHLAQVDPATEVDLLDGAAGTILVLLGLHRATGEQRVLRMAIAYGEHLLQRAERLRVGVGWRSAVTATPLAGLSHGAAGICWALAELAEASGQERFLALARNGLAYERTLFDPSRQNWRDLRRPDSPELNLPVSWCNGATGIGLARLAGLHLLHDEHTEIEIDASVQTTIAAGFEQNDSLCHGDFGNLELLLAAADAHPRWEHLRQLAYQRAGLSYAAAMRRGRWLSGWGVRRDEVAGLMTGLAGTGHSLLRLASGLRVPTPVTLAPPSKKEAAR